MVEELYILAAHTTEEWTFYDKNMHTAFLKCLSQVKQLTLTTQRSGVPSICGISNELQDVVSTNKTGKPKYAKQTPGNNK